MFRYILLAALVGVALAGDKKSTKCPWAFGKYPFDDVKFQGDWYLVSGTPMLSTKVAKCGKFNYKTNKPEADGSTTLNLRYTGVEDDKPVAIESIVTPIFGKSEKSANTMGVWRKEGTTDWTSVFKHSVVATDYNNYAVFVGCKQKFDEKTNTFGRHLFAGVWGRTRTLPKETVELLKNILSGYDIDVTELQDVDHSKC